MSTTAPPSEAAPAAPRRSQRRRGSQPAISLLAQGEPMVWLTGGALAACVAMIVSLLAIVVYYGALTFWPEPLLRVELIDGSRELGEVTRVEWYDLTAEKLKTFSGDTAAAAKRLLGDQEVRSIRRRLLRVGNYELSQKHFRWIDDFEIQPEKESRPEWALVLERVEWGRFYGEPAAMQVSRPREITAGEMELAAMSQLLEGNLYRLEDAQRPQGEAIWQRFVEQTAKIRGRNVEEFLQQIDRDASPVVEVGLEDGTSKPVGEAKADQQVTEVRTIWNTPQAAWRKYQELHGEVRERFEARRHLEKHELGAINARINAARLEVRGVELRRRVTLLDKAEELVSLQSQIALLDADLADKKRWLDLLNVRTQQNPAENAIVKKIATEVVAEIEQQKTEWLAGVDAIHTALRAMPGESFAVVTAYADVNRQVDAQRQAIQRDILRLDAENSRIALQMKTADGQETTLRLADVVLAYPANQLTLAGKWGVYLTRWREFLLDEPREANSEGGVFPAIFGTVVMTLFMSFAVVPFGVLAALYLREYAKGGAVVSAVRIAINNLAGVPSIVFGVFGLGFFCYILGAYVDGGPENAGFKPWPEKSWLAALAGLSLIAGGAFCCGLLGLPGDQPDTTRRRVLRGTAMSLWIVATLLLAALVLFTPYFQGFYQTNLPNPTFGKGGLLWSSLTLALLTVPVVIVATEEALSAVPNSMREGSYACGAGKWQTIRRIVLPQAAPGIMTGVILAMARGAGEVAPLMLVGAVKLAPELPVDGAFPFAHLERSFMHLGFHIYDVGFQSPNSEAAKPMVFTTTLLLIALIALLNVTAIWLRTRLRKRLKTGQF